jgi:uncharacterized protein YdaU (DUF1376 family)
MADRSANHAREPLPYYKWYWRDYRANRKVQRLSYTARGFYRELLDEQWDRGFIPNNLDELADICGCPKQVLEDEWQMLSKCFSEIEPGKLANSRLERERTESDKTRVNRRLAGRSGALAKQKVANADTCHIAEHKQEQNNSSQPFFDGSKAFEQLNAIWPKDRRDYSQNCQAKFVDCLQEADVPFILAQARAYVEKNGDYCEGLYKYLDSKKWKGGGVGPKMKKLRDPDSGEIFEVPA